MENYRTSTKNPENTFNQCNELSELGIWNSTVLPEFWLKQISCVQSTGDKHLSTWVIIEHQGNKRMVKEEAYWGDGVA